MQKNNIIVLSFLFAIITSFIPSSFSSNSYSFSWNSNFPAKPLHADILDRNSIKVISLRAVNDSARTNPLTNVTVDVVLNDTITCGDYTLSVSQFPDPVTIGIAEVLNNRDISFTPAQGFYGIVEIPYEIDCGSGNTGAILYITVNQYNIPLNVIPAEELCTTDMPRGVDFSPDLRIQDETINLNGFSMPLVGDLDGDGKPEIIGLGLMASGDGSGTGLAGAGQYIAIFNGQNGNPILKFDLRTLRGPNGETNFNYGSLAQFRLRAEPRHNGPCHLAIADLDNDGIGEIVVCETGTNGRVYALKPVIDSVTNNITTLTKIWDGNDNGVPYSYKLPLTGQDWTVLGAPMPYITDLNGDGIPEVIVYNKIYNGKTGQILLEMETLRYYIAQDSYTASEQLTRSQYSYVGRRHGVGPVMDDGTPVISIIDIDNDGELEIIAGMKIYKPVITNTDGKTGNYLVTPVVHGPRSVTLPTRVGSGSRTYQLLDGHTVVADVDGDGFLDIIVQSNITNNWDDNYRGLVVVWDPRFPDSVKAASIFRGYSAFGMSSIPFVGDINGRYDSYDGTKKLPEICFVTGVLCYDRSVDDYISGIPFHPLSADTLELNSRYFNRANGTAADRCQGHIFSLTFHGDETTPVHERLKISWAMEHEDRSANTGITMFDFDNDGIMELCYRDEQSIRVISPAMQTYIRKNVTDGPIRFRDNRIKSYTGYEAPVIADVNNDGSADIITLGYRDNGEHSYGYLYVFEHASGGDKWAPAPPVWNQGIYFPLQINEDLTVPAKPISTLTQFQNTDGEIITPYNGNWIQQPIVKEGNQYVPVIRQPNARITDAIVNLDQAQQTIDITLTNLGLTTLNYRTPLSLYIDSISPGNLILTTEIGIDIFPDDRSTLSFNLPALPNGETYNARLIYIRVMDDGVNFPATGYDDCDLSGNVFVTIDCPDMNVNISATPSASNICGYNASVLLEVQNPALFDNPEYQWYRNDLPIEGADLPIYFATTTGSYRLYVIDGLCRKFSAETIDITISGGNYPKPDLVVTPDTIICGDSASLYLYVRNYSELSSAIYFWFRNGERIQVNTNPYLITREPGLYQVYAASGGCGSHSNEINLILNPESGMEKPQITAGTPFCETGGRVLLQLTDPQNTTGMSFQWYLNYLPIEGAVNPWYITGTPGTYSLQVITSDTCAAFSDPLQIAVSEGEIAIPLIGKIPSSDTICTGGGLTMFVENYGLYRNPVYIWYQNGRTVQEGNNRFYQVTQPGYYFVEVVTTECRSISDETNIILSGNAIDKPVINSLTGNYTLCGINSMVELQVQGDISSYDNFIWFRNGQMIENANESVLIINTPGYYQVQIIQGNCSAFSDSVNIIQGAITDFPKPVVSRDPENGKLCGPGTSVLFQVDNIDDYSSSVTYTWFKNGIPEASYNDLYYFATERGEYYVRVDDGECSAISTGLSVDTSLLTLVPPTIYFTSGTDTLCGENGEIILQLRDHTQYPSSVEYRWYYNFGPVISDEGSSFSYRAGEAGLYGLRITDGECSAISNEIELFNREGDLPEPDFARRPSSGRICQGGSILLSIDNTDSYDDPVYLWFHNDTIIPVTEAIHEATLAGNYYVQVIDDGCSRISSTITLQESANTINPPVIESTITDNGICNDAAVVVLRVAGNRTGVTYQWYKDYTPIDGAVQPLYVARDSGNYIVQVVDGICSAISDTYHVSKNNAGEHPEPVIAIDPENGKLCAPNGQVKIFIENSSEFPGDNTYIWFRNYIEYSRTSDPVLYTSQAGNYFVQVYSGNCSYVSGSTSVNEEQQFIYPPNISVIPSDLTICGEMGAVVLRLVNYTEYGNSPQFQWYRNDTVLPDATGIIYRAFDPGNYRLRIITENGCSTFSASSVIDQNDNILTRPLVIPDPPSSEIIEGQSVTLTINNADLLGSPTEYIWYNETGIVSRGASNTVYTINLPGTYFVQAVYGTGCSSVSDTVAVTSASVTIARPQIDVTPDSEMLCAEGGYSLLNVINAASYQRPYYEWQYNGTPVPELTGPAIIVTDTGTYRVRVTDTLLLDNGSGPELTPVLSAFSEPIYIGSSASVIQRPVLGQSGTSICGTNGSLLLYLNNPEETYSPQAIYIWYKSDTLLQTSDSPTFLVTQPGEYHVRIIDEPCFTISDTISIISGTGEVPLPSISSIGNPNICGSNGTVVLQVDNAEDFQDSTFIWFKNNIPVPGERYRYLRVTEPGSYRVQGQLSDLCTRVSSALNIDSTSSNVTQPVIGRIPVQGEICGDTGIVVLFVSNRQALGEADFYWFRDENILVQTGGDTYEARLPGSYTVFATTAACASESAAEIIEQNSSSIVQPAIYSTSGSIDLCNNEPGLLLMMSTPESDYTNPVYQWYEGNSVIPGANLPRLVVSQPGSYRLFVTDNDCGAFSEEIQVNGRGSTVTYKPQLTLYPENNEICSNGGRILFTVNNAVVFGRNARYLWFNGNNQVKDSSEPFYYAGTPGTYFVQVITEAGCSSVSDERTINNSGNIIDLPVLTFYPDEKIICGEQGSVVITFNWEDFPRENGYSYQWFLDNAPISGQQGLYYTAVNPGAYRIQVTHSNGCATFSDPDTLQYEPDGGIITPEITKRPNASAICGNEGSIYMIATDAGSYAPDTRYIWYHNDTIVKNSNEPFYEAVGQNGAGTYYLQVILDNGCSATGYTQIDYTDDGGISKPVIVSEPSGNEICGNSGVVILKLDDPGQEYTGAVFRWYRNNLIIPQATAPLYKAREPGSYRLQVIMGTCGSISDSITMIRTASDMKEPLVSLEPPRGAICGPHSSVLLTVTNRDSFPAQSTYVWFNGNEEVARGEDLDVYEAVIAGTYSVQVIAGECSTLSGDYTVTNSSYNIANKPHISAIPSSETICGTSEGVVVLTFDNASLFADFTYLWYRDNEPVSPASTATVYFASEPGIYRVQVSLAECRALSDSLIISLDSNSTIDKPVLVSYPENGIICTGGGNILLSIENRTDYPPGTEFIWYQGTSIIERDTTPALLLTQSGNYHVVAVISDQCASVSDIVTVSQQIRDIEKPVVESTSGEYDICHEDGSVVLSIQNIGQYGNPAYQWFDRNLNPIAGAAGSLLVTDTSGTYYLQVKDGVCSAISSPVEVNMAGQGEDIVKPLIRRLPDNNAQLCEEFSNIILYVENTDQYTNPVFTWFKDNQLLRGNRTVMQQVSDSGTYFVQVIEGNCSAISDSIHISSISSENNISAPVIISSADEINTICGMDGSLVLQLIDTTGYGNALFQWYEDITPLTGSDSMIHIVTAPGTYRLLVTIGECSAFSDPIEIGINNTEDIEAPVLTMNPASGKLCGENASVILTVANHDRYDDPIYTWFRNNRIVTSTQYPEFEAREEGTYFVQAGDNTTSCVAVSSPPMVIFNDGNIELPLIESTSASYDICEDGGSILLWLTNSGEFQGADFQWFHNGDSIPGADLMIYNATTEGNYRIRVSYNGCIAFSDRINIYDRSDEIDRPVIRRDPANGIICGNAGSVTFTIDNDSLYPSATYNWFRNNILLENENSSVFTTSDTGTYFAQVVYGYCAAVSDTLSAYSGIKPEFSFRDTTLCAPDSIDLKALEPENGTITGLDMVYYDKEFNELSNTMIHSTDTFYIIGINTTGCSDTAAVNITIHPRPVYDFVSQDTSLCMGSRIDLSSMLNIQGTDTILYFTDRTGNNPLSDPVITPDTDTVFYFRVENIITHCASDIDSLQIYLYSSPVCAITGDSILCPGTEASYTALPGMKSYHWTINGDATLSDTLTPGTAIVLSDSTCDGEFILSLTITDFSDCTANCSFTVTVGATEQVAVSVPEAIDSTGCSFPDQNSVDLAFADWISRFEVSKEGCGVVLPDLSGYSAPDLCTGDTIKIIYAVTDGCSTAIDSSYFMIAKPVGVAISVPNDTAVNICDFAGQNELDIVFHNWTSLFTVTEEGCGVTIPDLQDSVILYNACDDIQKTITYSINDGCSSASAIRTFIATGDHNPPAVTGTLPQDTICEGGLLPIPATDISELELLGITVNDNCTPDMDIQLSNEDIPDTSEITRLYILEDLCGNRDTIRQIFILIPGPEIFDLTADSYCENDPDQGTIQLSSSETGIEYQLYQNGTAAQAPKQGNGTPLTWNIIPAGDYYVTAMVPGQTDCIVYTDTIEIIEYTTPVVSIPNDSIGAFMNATINIPVTFTGNDEFVIYYTVTHNITTYEDSVIIPSGTVSPYDWPFTVPSLTGTYYIRPDSVVSIHHCTGAVSGTYVITVGDCASDDFTIVCPNDTVLALPYGYCEYAFGDIGYPTITNILYGAIDTITNNAPADFTFPQGIHEVTWVATDQCGRSDSCTQIVIVNFSPCGDTDTVYYFEGGTVADSIRSLVAIDYEGNTYSTARIGCDCWTTENLISTKYSDGSIIPGHTIYYSRQYPDTNANLATFGRLYDWYSANRQPSRNRIASVQGACPTGWALPDVDNFEMLIPYGTDALKAPGLWMDGNSSNNSSGFNALPAGYYNPDSGTYYFLYGDTYFWTSHSTSTSIATACHIRFNCPEILIEDHKKDAGFSIRCVKINE